jgi:hypothetical protein
MVPCQPETRTSTRRVPSYPRYYRALGLSEREPNQPDQSVGNHCITQLLTLIYCAVTYFRPFQVADSRSCRTGSFDVMMEHEQTNQNRQS